MAALGVLAGGFAVGVGDQLAEVARRVGAQQRLVDALRARLPAGAPAPPAPGIRPRRSSRAPGDGALPRLFSRPRRSASTSPPSRPTRSRRRASAGPDGASLLVTRGQLNLTHREGHDRVVPLVPGEPFAVRIPLDAIAHRFAAGSRLRVAVSPTYWPLAWPSPEPVTLGLVAGESSIALPLHDAATAPPAPALCPPEEPPAYPMTELVAGHGARTITRELRHRRTRAALRLGSRRHEPRRDHGHRDHVRGRRRLRDPRGRSALGARRLHERRPRSAARPTAGTHAPRRAAR